MERLTERKYGEIVSSKREREQIHCSNFCNNCSQGTGNCAYVKDMVEKLAEYEDLEERLEKIFNGELPLKVYVDLLECHVLDRERTDQLSARMLTYEDAEEWDEYKRLRDSSLLLKLPCKVGDTVYAITSPFNLRLDMEDELDVFKCVVESISFYKNGMHQLRLYHEGKFVGWLVQFTDLGKTVFLTKEEAEQALVKMKEGANGD